MGVNGYGRRLGRLEELSLVRRAERLRRWMIERHGDDIGLEGALEVLKGTIEVREGVVSPPEGDLQAHCRRLAAEEGLDPDEVWALAEKLAADPEFEELIRP